MKNKITICLASLVMLALSACSTVDIKPDSLIHATAIQAGTLKLIEQSSDIDAQDVLQFIDRIRPIIDNSATISTSDLIAQAVSHIPMDTLAPSDQMLVRLLLLHVSKSLEERQLLSEERTVALITVLGWAEQAALMAL